MNKDALLEMLQNKYGDSIDLSLITDEDMATFIQPEPPIPDDVPDDTGNPDEIPPVVDNGDDDYADDINLDDVDESQLDENGKILLRVLKNERKKFMQEKMRTLVSTSGVDEASQIMLNKMIKLGVTEEDLKQTIADINATALRKSRTNILGDKTFGKGQLRTKIAQKSTQPKVGSKDFGALLAKRK